MLIIDKDNLQAFIGRKSYDQIENKPFCISFVVQINGKIKTTYADIFVVSKDTYIKKHSGNNDVCKEIKTTFVIDDQSELLSTINTLHNLGYDTGDIVLMRDKISQYVSNYF